jgi:HAD superfamily hydrolase (TIGR01509 family)
MIEALLCDIDGTLVDSNWLHASAWKDAFAAVDIVVELEEARRQIGKGGDELIPVFVPWTTRNILEEPLTAYRQYIFRTDYLHQVKPFPQVRELFLKLKEMGVHVALASSADRDQLEAYKKIANIGDVVEESSTSEDAKRSKPHPDIFESTLKKLGLPASKVLALGDTPYDAEAAGKAEIYTIGVETGGWTEKELMNAGCIEVYKDVADLFANLETSVLQRW